MDVKRLRVAACPSDKHAQLNRAVVDPRVFGDIRHVEINTQQSPRTFVFTLEPLNGFNPEEMGFSLPMRKWAELPLNATIEVRPYRFDVKNQCVSVITLEVDFMMKNTLSNDVYDTDEMAIHFTQLFADQAFTVGQIIAFKCGDKKILKLTVKEMQVLDVTSIKGDGPKSNTPKTTKVGLVSPNSTAVFVEAPDSAIKLKGKSKSGAPQQTLITPNWDFESLGIGGLDKEFNDIFRRAFASKVIPIELVEQLGLTHVRGILLYGPPGTGKTLIARQIGKMLNARPPKIVNGPSILDKYVGESEANIRKLFEDAEIEFKKVGNRSGLHIIIFDEIDAICKSRGSVAGASGVHDSVVNQLLSKIDGVESLNNILVIGMTNRKDMIDDALLRPGRFEVQIEIGLPDEQGRVQILKIHTGRMKQHKRLADDVDLQELAALTKNFSGAELEGLVRAAQATAMNRLIKASNRVEVDPEAFSKLIVCRNDFLHALEHDIKPAFGTNSDEIVGLLDRGIINWCPQIEAILEKGQLLIQQARDPTSRRVVPVLLEGPSNAGKSALAATIAMNSDFPFIKLCTPENMIGYTESAKCQIIRKIFDDAYKSHLSCVLVDNIEHLLDFSPIGPRYSNLVLQALTVLLQRKPPKGRCILIVCTTSRLQILQELDMTSSFRSIIHVSEMNHPDHILKVIQQLSATSGNEIFSRKDCTYIAQKLREYQIRVGVKKLIQIYDSAKDFDPSERAQRFLQELEDEGCISLISIQGY